jgi:hypothetical protein
MIESLFMAQYNSELEEFAENENSLDLGENPSKFHWHVSQKDPLTGEVWEDYCDTEEEAMELIEKAKKDGFEYEWAKYNDIEYPA